MVGDIPTDRQFNSLKRYFGNYAQAVKAMFVVWASHMGEIKATEARGEKASKVAWVGTVKPTEPVSHGIREYATWLQQDGQPESYRRHLLDSND